MRAYAVRSTLEGKEPKASTQRKPTRLGRPRLFRIPGDERDFLISRQSGTLLEGDGEMEGVEGPQPMCQNEPIRRWEDDLRAQPE